MLIVTRQGFMQAIQKAAIAGFYYHVSGTLPLEKLPGFVKKMQRQYQVNPPRHKVYYEKKQGRASVRLFCYGDPAHLTGSRVLWVMMVNEGEHPIYEHESLQDCRLKSSRLGYDIFELVQKPALKGKPSGWTWRIKPPEMPVCRFQMQVFIRDKNEKLTEMVARHYSAMPGFSGVRAQKKKLIQFWHSELKRVGWQGRYPIRNMYLRQVPVEHVIYLEAFVKRAQADRLSVVKALKYYRVGLRSRKRKKRRAAQKNQKKALT